MSDEKVVYLAFHNTEKTTVGSIERLACKACRNKTFVVTYDDASEYPALRCACCGADCGRFGWAPEQEKA